MCLPSVFEPCHSPQLLMSYSWEISMDSLLSCHSFLSFQNGVSLVISLGSDGIFRSRFH